jgi:predicted branched-subunit amino acid permease
LLLQSNRAAHATLPCRANLCAACYEVAVSESPVRFAPASSEGAHLPNARQWYARGLFAGITSVQGGVLFASYVGFGGLCADIGFPMGAAVVSTFLIAALPSQLLLVGGYVAGNGALVIALGVLLSAARLLPSVVTLLPYLRGRIPVQLFAAHFVAVSVWVEGRRLLPPLPPKGRLPFYFGMVTVFNVGCVAATFIGYMLAGRLPHALAVGLTFLTPISFLLALTRNSRDLVDYLSLAFGLALGPLFAAYGGQLDLLWTGLAGGSAAWLIHRSRKKARAA